MSSQSPEGEDEDHDADDATDGGRRAVTHIEHYNQHDRQGAIDDDDDDDATIEWGWGGDDGRNGGGGMEEDTHRTQTKLKQNLIWRGMEVEWLLEFE